MPKAPDETFSITKTPDFTSVNTNSKSSRRLEPRGHPLRPHRRLRTNSDGICVPARHR